MMCDTFYFPFFHQVRHHRKHLRKQIARSHLTCRDGKSTCQSDGSATTTRVKQWDQIETILTIKFLEDLQVGELRSELKDIKN